MTGAVLTSGVGAYLATQVGASTPTLVGRGELTAPPMIGMFIAHPFIAFIALLGGTMGVSAVSRVRGLNVLALGALAFFVGLFIAPAIYFAQMAASTGHTLSSAPVLHAFSLAVGGFVGLSGYAIVSGRDFSAIGGFLSMGLWVVIGAGLLNIFLGASVLSLAVASATVLLFGGFVLYDTSRMLREGDLEPVPAALNLYLNFLNLFLALLRILSGSRSSS
jgi:modulator of FtsH protease